MRSISTCFWGSVALVLLSSSIAWGQGVWSEVPPGERWEHACAWDPIENVLYTTGGLTNSGNDTQTDALFFDAAGHPTWIQVPTTGGPPPVRSAASLVFDASTGRLVLFGGFGAGYLNDVWVLDVGTFTWQQLFPAGVPPSPRGFHTAIYDAVNHRMVVFGGFGGSYLNDTWALSLTGPPVWTKLTTTGGPPSVRANHTAVYDGGGRMFVFGGEDPAPKNDTWSFALATATWSQLSTLGLPPSARFAHSAVFDEINSRMVIYGGNVAFLNDVWELPIATLQWNQLTTFVSPDVGPPSGRYFHRAVYDRPNQRMLVYGGNGGTILGDTWALSLMGPAQWTALSPTPRFASHVGYDWLRGRVTVFGGLSPGGLVLEDVWAYDPVNGFWTQLLPAGSKPPARFLGSVIYDRANDRFVLFGGFGATEYNDVWSFAPGTATWTQLLPGGTSPPARYGHTAVYDEAFGRMLVFGGRTNAGMVDNDIWSLRLNGPPNWGHFITGAMPVAREGHSSVFDPVSWSDPSAGHMIVFGGQNLGAPLSDTWDWIAAGVPSWSSLVAGSPGDRYYSTATYDFQRDRMLLFGGTSAGAVQNDLWQMPFYDTKVWSKQFPVGLPPEAREFAGGAYAYATQRMFVFSGRGSGVVFNDLWQLDLSAVPVGVSEPGAAAQLRLGPVTPNPGAGVVRMALELPAPGAVEFSVYDVAGRLTWSSSRTMLAGRHELRWDGRAFEGRRARAGVYLAKVRAGGKEQARRFVLL